MTLREKAIEIFKKALENLYDQGFEVCDATTAQGDCYEDYIEIITPGDGDPIFLREVE